MVKQIKFTKKLTRDDDLDITLFYEKGRIIKFALNYRAIIKGKSQPIYRVDNYHGFLHEQRFWRTKEPIPLTETGLSNNEIVTKYVNQICINFQKYKGYYSKK